MAYKVIGKDVPRIDGRERVTGQARYTEDISLPGMLYARVLRSPIPHGRVRSIDTSAAEKLPGVVAILHCKNNNQIWRGRPDGYGGDIKGRRRVFAETVRFVGDAVAAVAAMDRHTAEDALELIKVDYETLPFVLRTEDATAPGAPAIFPEGNVREGDPAIQTRGDIEEGFRQADLIYEQEFTSQHVCNAQLERRVSMAHWEGDQLTVWASTQGIYSCRHDIAADLKLPLGKVRVICHYMGGGFGNKNQALDFDLVAALLARHTGRPVRVECTRHEDFIAVHGRWPTRQHYRIGVKKDGAITATDFKGVSSMGAYLRTTNGGISGGLYAAPNSRSEISRIHTNVTLAGHFRAPGGPQGVFAIESAIDDIAQQLQMDPLELRLKNLAQYREGGRLASSSLMECITRGTAAIGWAEKRARNAQQGSLRRGVGMALASMNSSIGESCATVRLLPDGSVRLHVGVTDIGTGAKTTLALIAAEALGVHLNTVGIVSGDTDATPYSIGESNSRTTVFTGHAVREAATQVKNQLLDQAAAQLKVPRAELDLSDGRIVRASSPDTWRIEEVTSDNVDAITAAVTNDPGPGSGTRNSYGAHFAEVEVDRDTGRVRVVRYVAVHESGTIINRLTAASQVKGAVAQGIGMALREELIWDRRTGIPVNPHYHGAKVLVHPEAPDVEVIFVESEEEYGAYGAKTLGEVCIIPVVGAVANAVFHATGARIRNLPMSPDKLLTALREVTP
jgi:xanthine dehydrogenase YagR molybdenum-binding subunit